MDDYTANNFLRKHRNLFKKLTFGFYNFKPETKEGFKKIIKDLGGNVSSNAEYIFIDPHDKVNRKRRFYDVRFILDSVFAGKVLDIESYRLSEIVDSNLRQAKRKEFVKIKKEKDIKQEVESNEEYNGNSSNSEQIYIPSSGEDKADAIRKNPFTKKQKKIQKTANTAKSSKQISSRSNIENDNKQSNGNDVSVDATEKFSSSEEEGEVDLNNWWAVRDVPLKYRCKIEKCSFAAVPHEKHVVPSRFLTILEKRIILRYLIQNNSITLSKGIKVWKHMRMEGYLTHRTIETIRNCYRRGILPVIEKFNLPKDLERKFTDLRERYGCKK